MARTYRWQIIGHPRLPLKSGDLWNALGIKHRALLAYLLVSGDELSREDVAQALWPHADPARARHSLRQVLTGLRTALGPSDAHRLRSKSGSLSFQTDGLEIDLQEFVSLETVEEPTPKKIIDLCQGHLFDGIDARSDVFATVLNEWRQEFANRAVSLIDSTLARESAVMSADDTTALEKLRGAYAFNTDEGVSFNTLGASHAPMPEPIQSSASGWRTATIAIVGLVAGAALLVTSFLMFPDFRRYLTDLVPGRGGLAPKIAVRPFTALSGDESERQLAGGVTIGVTYALYSITDRELLVITAPQTSTKSGEVDVPGDFASDLGVRYLIHGALEREDDTVRVFVSFYDAEIGADIWQDRFDSDFTEAFGLQDAITLRILQGLDIDLSKAERNRLQYLDDTEVLSAWLLAANGVRNLITLDPQHLDEAFASYKRALEFDPDYISARRGLAWHALLDVRFGLAEDPERSIREARQHLDVILRRRPNDGMSLALQALMLILENDWDTAIDSAREATRLLPGSADVWAVLAHNYTFSGQPDLALESIDRAMSLSPGHPDFYSWIKGRALRLKGEYENALEHVTKGLNERSPTIVQLVELATVYSALGRQVEARETGKEIRRIDPDFSASEWVLHPALKDSVAQSLEFELLSKAGL